MGQMNGPAPQPQPQDGEPFANAGKLVGEENAYKIEKFGQKGNNTPYSPHSGTRATFIWRRSLSEA